MTSEIRQYTALRLIVISAGAVLFFVLGITSYRLWPVISQVLQPTTLNCGCAVVAIHTSWWMIVTATGVMTLTLYTFSRFVYKLLRHYHQNRRTLRDLQRQGQRAAFNHDLGGMVWIIPDQQPVAYTIGLLRPRIIISQGLLSRLSRAELRAVLMHERAHQRSYDPLMLMVLESITGAWHWLPGLRNLMNSAYSLRELAADAQATDAYRSPEALSSAFLKLHDIATHPVLSAFSPNRDRLEKLLDYHWSSPRRWWEWTSVASIVLILAGGVLVGRSVRASETEIPAAAAMACHETMVMCQAVPAPTTTLKSICTGDRCVTMQRPWSSRYGLTLVQ